MSWLTDLFKDKAVDMRESQYRSLPDNPKNLQTLKRLDEDRLPGLTFSHYSKLSATTTPTLTAINPDDEGTLMYSRRHN